MNRTACWLVVVCTCVLAGQAAPDSLSAKATEATSITQVSIQARDTTLSSTEKPNLFNNFLEDQGAIWTSPLRMEWEDAALWGGLTAATAFLIAYDEPISRSVIAFRNDHTWVQKASPIATQFGEFYVPFGIAAAYCFSGLVFKDEESLNTGLLAAQAMLHSGIVVQVLKHLFGRSRPFVRHHRDAWYGPRVLFTRYHDGGFSPYDSFPSGHTITAFSLATVLAERERPWVGFTAYTLAGLSGLSRLTENEHWASDVLVGAALGIAIGKLVVNNHNERLTLYPSIGENSAGVVIQLNY